MKEPDVVTVYFGHLPATRLLELLEVSSVWMLQSDRNDDEVRIAETKGLIVLPSQISFCPLEPNESRAEWLASVLEEIDCHHDDFIWTQWKRIDIVGLERTPELEAVAREFGELNSADRGFSITHAD